MKDSLQRQSRTVFGLIIALQLATSFGAIALLARMGPAIARVAEENVESLTAVEEMMLALALAGPGEGSETARGAFFQAHAAAERNITEDSERALLDEIRTAADGALAGDGGARARAFRALEELAQVNREALQRADLEAQRLSEAGAWAMVALAIVAFVFVRYVANRVERRFVGPVAEIANTLDAAREGDRFRRCSGGAGSPELRSIAEGVNRLLDEPRRGAVGRTKSLSKTVAKRTEPG